MGQSFVEILKSFKISKNTLQEIGSYLVKQLVAEAKKDAVKKIPTKGKETIPDSRDFYESFSYTVVGGEIVVSSNWPGFERFIEGRDPYEMKWLTSKAGNPKIIPLTDSDTGQLIFRMAPLQGRGFWVHPGVVKSAFYNRAIKKAEEKAAELIGRDLKEALKKGTSLK